MKKLSKYEMALAKVATESYMSAVLAFGHCHGIISNVKGVSEKYTDEAPAIGYALQYERIKRKLALMRSPIGVASYMYASQAHPSDALLLRMRIVVHVLKNKDTHAFLSYVSRLEL